MQIQTEAKRLEKLLADKEDEVAIERQEDRNVNRASKAGWAYDCTRHLVLARLAPEKEVITIEQRRRFAEGVKQEELIRQDFKRAGVPIMEFFNEQDRGIMMCREMPTLQMKLEPDDLFMLDHLVPVDYKSCSSAVMREVKHYEVSEEMKKSRMIWIRHYPVQMLIYCAGFQAPYGLMPFKDKEAGGPPHIINCPFNSGEFSYLYDVFMDVNKKVEHEDVPVVINDNKVCDHCGFLNHCYPETEKPKALTTKVSDQDTAMKLMSLLLHRQKLIEDGIKEQAKELEKAEDQIKEEVKALGEVVEIGGFTVTLAKTTKTDYDIPKEVKEKFKIIKEIYKPMKIQYSGDTV